MAAPTMAHPVPDGSHQEPPGRAGGDAPVPRLRGCRQRPAHEREELGEVLYARLHAVTALLGLLFLVLVLAQAGATPGQPLHTVLVVGTWVLWAVFVGEYVLRLVIAPDRSAFLARTWWQVLLTREAKALKAS